MAKRYQVVIVGGGPVGMGLACDLGLRGIETAVVERRYTPQRIPKGQGLTQRTLEHFYFWGIADELRAARLLPPGYPIGGVTAYGDLMSPYWFAPAGREVVQDYYFLRNERLPQYLMEEVLRRRVTDLPNVECLFGQAVTQAGQDNNTASVTTEGGDVLEADYVIGCDGARSTVREQLGIDRDGADFDQRMVLAVLRSRELHEGLKRFPERTTYRVLRPELKGYWQFFGRVDVGEGFFFHAPVPPETTPENYDFLGLIQQAAGFPVRAEFDHVGFWDLRIAVASTYRINRVFIAGDACHSHPPYGGFGLNSGLEDVANLGWKLAARLNGWGSERLLDSYSAERRPIFVETGDAMIAGGIERDREFLDRYNPERNAEEFEQAWQDLEQDARTRQQSYEPHYEGSPVVVGPPGAVCSIHGKYAFAAQAGHHLAPLALTSDRNVFEELSDGFTLLALDSPDSTVQPFIEAARCLSIPLRVVRDTYDGPRQAYEARLVLVRPDQYVVWSGNTAPPDAAAILRTATGR